MKSSYTVTVRKRRDGELFITIPRQIIRIFGLRTGDTARFRKERGKHSFIVTFFRGKKQLLPASDQRTEKRLKTTHELADRAESMIAAAKKGMPSK